MSNSLLTLNLITRKAVALFRNSNAFIQNIDRQYDGYFAQTGAKAGNTLRVRLPNDYTVRTGAALQVQDTTEQSIALTVATQKGVDVSFSTAERTMSLDDYSERVLAPAVNNLAGNIAADIMSGAEAGVCNLVSNTDSSGNIIAPVSTTYLNAGATLTTNSAPLSMRKVVNDPFTDAAITSSLQGLLNPVPEISRQFRTGHMKEGLGIELWMQDQTVLKHTTGTFSAGGTISGAGQTGTTITVAAITGTLKKGDIITIEGVNAVNRVTKQTTGILRQFVVTADVSNGGTSISIYPAIIPPVGGNPVQYQTVDASPANGAAIALATPAGSTYRKNLLYVPQALTMVIADLEMIGGGVIEEARETFDGISMRMITDYLPGTDQKVTRLDLLYGYLFIRPEWLVTICDSV